MSDIRRAREALVARILEGSGSASRTQHRAAFDNAGLPEPVSTLVEKVARHACKVTDDDIAAVRMAGFSEDQIFELVVCAAIGQQRGNTKGHSQLLRPPPEGLSMRLAILDRGHGFTTKLLFALIRAVSRQRCWTSSNW
jgi:hypothetical protein